MTTLCEKYRPICFADIKGQEEAVYNLKKFFQEFPRKKSLIFNGPAGTGKTSLVHSLAKELSLEIIELNASDLRNREQIESILKQASQQVSLFNKGKIILVDEVDGVSHEDTGGLSTLYELIKESSFPIIMTANNIWNKKFSSIRNISQIVGLKELGYLSVIAILKSIAEKEKITISEEMLKTIAIKSRGDARAAINDLETIRKVNTEASEIHERDKEVDIFNVLKTIFKNLPDKNTLNLYDSVNLSLDDIFLWIEENIPAEYSGEELYKAYDALSIADLFRGRVYRQQHWRFLVYQNIFLSAGISAAKKTPKTGFKRYSNPKRILKMWMINQKDKNKKTIAAKLALYCHIGTKRAMKEMPFFIPLLKDKTLQKTLKLGDEEVEFVDNYSK